MCSQCKTQGCGRREQCAMLREAWVTGSPAISPSSSLCPRLLLSLPRLILVLSLTYHLHIHRLESQFKSWRFGPQSVVIMIGIHEQRIRDHGMEVVTELSPLGECRDLPRIVNLAVVLQFISSSAPLEKEVMVTIGQSPFAPTLGDPVNGRNSTRMNGRPGHAVNFRRFEVSRRVRLIEDVAGEVISRVKALHVLPVRSG